METIIDLLSKTLIQDCTEIDQVTEELLELYQEPSAVHVLIDSFLSTEAANLRKAIAIALENSIKHEYDLEKDKIDSTTSGLIKKMQTKYEEYKTTHFLNLRNEIGALVNLLYQDYQDEWGKLSASFTQFYNLSFEQNVSNLHFFIDNINALVFELNNVNFDQLVPPLNIEFTGESFITYTTNKENAISYGVTHKPVSTIADPKPIRALVAQTLAYCRQAIDCIDFLLYEYDKMFDIEAFNSHVKREAAAWLAEYKAKLSNKYSKRFDELFVNEKAKAIPQSFFTTLRREGEQFDVNINAGTNTYNQSITIGNVKLLVENNQKHLDYIKKSSSLKTYLDNGHLVAPVILDLKKCGNVLLNVNEDTYSQETIDFVNQLIIQFLLSFPANRINLCLIDIDNKVGFSQFKSLTKINNNILFKGIIRDDRQLENTIKDMEQTMYKIDDDFLSYNNVEDIFEYNSKYEANPQSVHLFVLVNYPSGMRDDTAKRVIKLLQSGNRTGIFSIIVNNRACTLSPGYKTTEYQQFLDFATNNSVVVSKNGSTFTLNNPIKNIFEPKKNITINTLPSIIEM